jgi:capsular exopolysaccharide synthesis family protein
LTKEHVTIGQGLGDLARFGLASPELRNAYSNLLGGICLSTAFESGKSILVTSAKPNEGKTTVASCLAMTASLAGQAVLLIDGDLRRPWLGSAAGIVDGVGLGEVLGGHAEAEEAIHKVDLTDELHQDCPLSILAAGHRSAALLPAIDWAKARATLHALSQRFDIVVLDSPPVLAANDALLLAGIVDAVVLVVGAGSADREEVRRVKQQLEPIGTPIIGAVLNRFDPKIHGRSTQPYHDYYLAAHT